MTAWIPLAVPNIGELERSLVTAALDSGFVSSVGPFVSQFEEEFAAAVGSRFAVACSSGTAAIHLALMALGVKHGDEVAVSDFTFMGSANPVAYLGGTTLLVDSEPRSWNLDQDLLAAELKSRAAGGEVLPAAVEVVHVLGQPASIDRLIPLCSELAIPVIEDAAEALGAGWLTSSGPRSVGTLGTIGTFSFNGNKLATTGGGGMLVTADPQIAEQARHLSTQAKVQGTAYLHDQVGFNYRMTNVAAALGLAQIRRLPELLAAKQAIAARYDSALIETCLQPPPRLAWSTASYWLYSVLVPNAGLRDDLLDFLRQRGIEARPLWRPLHAQPPLAGSTRLGGAVAVDLFARGLSLPSSTGLSESDQRRVIDALHEWQAAR